MLSHHAEVFKQLENTFPDATVYVGTSDKVEGEKSPFNFGEKQQIISTHGIPAERVINASRPYHKDDYPFDEDNTIIIFAVGEKDTDRFPMNNVDSNTGLDMTVRGEPRPKYYQMINTISKNPLPMRDRGYIYYAPSIERDEEVASASAFRQSIQNAPDVESAKQIFNKEFLNYDEAVFDMVYDKIKGSKMKEEINILRKLSGLQINEESPIEFEPNADPKNVNFLEPSKSSAQYSIANRFPADADPNDPEVKKEQFIQALLKSPESLLSEINERIDPKDPNGEAVSDKLSKIIDSMDDKGILGLDDSDKAFVLEIVKNAIKGMSLEAGDDSPDYEGEPDVNKMDFESIDFNDIKEEYGVEDDVDESLDAGVDSNQFREFGRFRQDIAKMYGDMGEAEISRAWELVKQRRGSKAKAIEAYRIAIQKMAIRGIKPKSHRLSEGGEAWDIMITDAESHILDCSDQDECIRGLESMKHANPEDFGDELANDVVDNYVEMIQKNGLRQVQAEIESGQQEPNFESSLAENEETKENLFQKFANAVSNGWKSISNWPLWAKFTAALGIGGAGVLTISGFLNAIKNNWQLISLLSIGGVALYEYLRRAGIKEQEAKRLQAEWDLYMKKQYLELSQKEQKLAKELEKKTKNRLSWDDYDTEEDWLKKTESFDPSNEPSKKDLAINHMMDGDFESAGEVLGGTGDDVMDEWNEYCSERGLDRKDALNDIDHVENCVDEMMSSMDDKDFPYEMESLEEGNMSFTDFVKRARETNKLNAIRDKHLIIKAYELFLKGVAETPGEAIDMAQAHMDNMAFEAIKEYNELRKLSGLTTLEEQLEGIELPENDGDLPGKGAGENKGRLIGDLVGIGLSVPVAYYFLLGLTGIITGAIAPGQPLFKAFKQLFTNPKGLSALDNIILTNAGITLVGLPIMYKVVRWASKTFGGQLGKVFDVKADPEYQA